MSGQDDRVFGGGCVRHRDPHNLCPECWKVEPESVASLVARLADAQEALRRFELLANNYDTEGQSWNTNVASSIRFVLSTCSALSGWSIDNIDNTAAPSLPATQTKEQHEG